MRIVQAPDLCHSRTIDQHHRRFRLGDGQKPMPVHLGVKQLRRVGQIYLVHVIVDRSSPPLSKMGNGEAIVGEPGRPSAAVEAGEFLQEVDLVDAGRVPDLFNGPDKHPLGPVLRGLGAEKDAHGRFDAGGDAVRRGQDDPLGLCPSLGPPDFVREGQELRHDATCCQEGHRFLGTDPRGAASVSRPTFPAQAPSGTNTDSRMVAKVLQM